MPEAILVLTPSTPVVSGCPLNWSSCASPQVDCSFSADLDSFDLSQSVSADHKEGVEGAFVQAFMETGETAYSSFLLSVALCFSLGAASTP